MIPRLRWACATTSAQLNKLETPWAAILFFNAPLCNTCRMNSPIMKLFLQIYCHFSITNIVREYTMSRNQTIFAIACCSHSPMTSKNATFFTARLRQTCRNNSSPIIYHNPWWSKIAKKKTRLRQERLWPLHWAWEQTKADNGPMDRSGRVESESQ